MTYGIFDGGDKRGAGFGEEPEACCDFGIQVSANRTQEISADRYSQGF